MFFKRFALAMGIALGLGYSTPAATEARSYVLATGSAGATYYPAGAALATLITVKLQPAQKITMAPITSPGSAENARLLQENKAQFALLSALLGHYAWTGQDPFAADGPHTHLRSVTTLWRNVEHFIVKKEYAKTGTIEDMRGLQGKPVFLGPQGSGTLHSSRFLLGNLGIDIDNDMRLVSLTFDQSLEAFRKGWIKALAIEAGTPISAITLVMTALGHELVLLEFTDTQLEKANGGLDLWSRYVIKAGTYPTQDKDIHTIAMPTFLAVRADADQDAVYQITKTIHENLPFLRAIHKVFSATGLDNALTGLLVPLHPGALRYYQEVGHPLASQLIAE